MWTLAGLVLALIGAALAFGRRSRAGGYYAREVYDLRPQSHRRFGLLSLAFAGAFALLAAFPVVWAPWLLAPYVLLFLLYAASFARGAAEEDER